MIKLATASIVLVMFIAGCSSSSNDSWKSISITAIQPAAWEDKPEDFIEFVIDIGSPNETDGNIIVYFDASGAALSRSDVAGNTDLQNGYVEIPSGHHHKAIRIEGLTSDGFITETQPITLKITGCSSAEYSIGPESEATAVVMDGDGGTVTDIDDNEYRTVLIGTQIWLAENLRTSRYTNGDTITGSWFYFNNPAYGALYGRLYDWHSVNDSRGLCPQFWHIPNQAELQTLASQAGNSSNALKAVGQGWSNGRGTNTSGFSAMLAGGCDGYGGCYYDYDFFDLGYYAYIWSSTEYDEPCAYNLNLSFINNVVYYHHSNKNSGYCVRCVLD